MFDFLENSKVKDLLPDEHHILQFVRQWGIASMYASGLVNAGRLEAPTDLTPKQFELASKIINEIEHRESVPIKDLSQLKVDEYVKLLSQRMQEVAFQEFRVDKNRGRILLDELRSQQSIN